MKMNKWRVWYLPTRRCRKAISVDVEATGKVDAILCATSQLGMLVVFLNTFEIPDDDNI